MKKTILALAITGLFATSAQAVEVLKTDAVTVDFYGQLRTSLKFEENENGKLSAGSSRTGVNLSSAITEGLTVFGGYEFGLGGNKDSDDQLEGRLHFFGVDTDYGKITVGKQWVSADDVWGADYSYFYGGKAIALAEELGGGLHTSLIKYNAEFAGVWINANVGLDEDEKNNELYEAFVGTSFGDLSVHVGGGIDKNNTTTAASLGLNTAGTASKITAASTADKKNTYAEATIEYAFDGALIGVQYYYSELKDGATTTDRDGYAISGTYDLTSQLGLYGGFEFVENATVKDAAGNDVIKDIDNTYLGASYTFNKFARVFVEGAVTDGDNKLGFGGRVYW